MTSGNFRPYPVASITVDRAKRQRKELKPEHITELAESIARIGLIHPIVITEDGELVAGECRLTAIKQLGWDQIPTQFVSDLSENELKAIELEENVKRQNLTWQEECEAVNEYHELQSTIHEEWSYTDTADSLGISPRSVSAKINVAQALNDETVANAPKYSTARNIVARQQSRKAAAVIEEIEETPAVLVREAPLLNADFSKWMKSYKGPKFNFIHCDFPYGVNFHKSGQSAGAEFGRYEDGEDVYWKLISTLRDSMTNVVHESAHLMFWFSMDYYAKTISELEEMGWRVNPFPLVWVKSDNTGIIPDAQRGPRRIYETALFASRGDRKVVTAVSNAFSHPGRQKEIHSNEKPVAMLKHFQRMFVDEYSFVLDPTCGSANALKAANALGAKKVLGLEINESFYQLAKENYYDDAQISMEL